VETGFPKRSCSNKKLERDADPTITHPALDVAVLHLRRDAIRLVLADGAEHGDRAGIRR
jgi:hypothetical protein